ncbi:MAG: hypothetical protein NC413_12955 [Muribaculum sp.]|nr:hypothetical protein [Muribaculum sp.]
MATIDLKAENKILRLVYELQDRLVWCNVYYINDGKIMRLAEERLEKILSKLIIGFWEIEGRNFYTRSGLEMYTVTTLMGPLSGLTAHIEEHGGVRLIFIDTHGNVFPLMRLTMEDKINWITQIFEHMSDYMLEHRSQ